MSIDFRLAERRSTTACSSEARLLRLYNMVPQPLQHEDPCGTLDNVSVQILRKFHGSMMETCDPLAVQGDGNCLYRAASLAMFSTQDLHMYLRIRIASELITHQRQYDISSNDAHPEVGSIEPSPFLSLLNDALTPGA